MKKISILLAVYNGELYLDSSIRSVYEQTFSDWELIIVENGSTDKSLEVIQKWVNIDSRIKVFVNSEKGKNKAFNRAFSESSSECICFFAADDVLHPDSLIRRYEILGRDFNFSTCLLRTISEDKIYDGIIFPKNPNKPNFSGGSIFFSRNLALKIFPIPECLPNEDVWTSLHLKNFGNGIHLPESLYFYRIHSNNSYGYNDSFTFKRKGFLTRMVAFELFLSKYKDELSEFKVNYFKEFSKGRLAAENNNILKILFTKLPIKDKIIFIYFCSPLLFWVKKRLFKYLSGKIELI
jgi:glycosyltransferase involved in cell wall biosynthesis